MCVLLSLADPSVLGKIRDKKLRVKYLDDDDNSITMSSEVLYRNIGERALPIIAQRDWNMCVSLKAQEWKTLPKPILHLHILGTYFLPCGFMHAIAYIAQHRSRHESAKHS